LGHGSSDSEYNWFRSSIGQFQSSMESVFWNGATVEEEDETEEEELIRLEELVCPEEVVETEDEDDDEVEEAFDPMLA